MTQELSKTYNPQEVEERTYREWERENLFHAPDTTKKNPYCIVIPPPNITGALHMGHALNNTIQDILIRYKRMDGYAALWMPGTDHAGIATQNVVEKEILGKEGKTRHDLGREKLLERIWKWREEYGNRILEQLKRMGCSCDWERTRFTLDDGLSQAVRECFVRLYEEGLIYKGKYIVNWCPRCHTALADDEVEHEEKAGHLWHLKYPLADGSGFVTVATTRPETLLGDTAVAVNPKDKRYKKIVGKMVKLPETDREIPIITDDFVDATFGSGAVKVTPAHDPNDFAIGERHHLPRVNVMNEDATMSSIAGKTYAGMTREACRKAIVAAYEKAGLVEKIEDHTHAVGHCYRCNTVIEPWLSDQWFVKMKPLAALAVRASKAKKVRFHPKRWEQFYFQWLDNVRDWCISRQIWWGHRIPVWYCKTCQPIVTREDPVSCPQCGSKDLVQDEDVLDTWFSSALWPFSTLGWPGKTPALKTYYPTSVLSTDRGIIFFWVARMVMMGMKHMNAVPFSDVYIHSTILDALGRKMSKSLGNGIDPIDMIQTYGADAMRFSLILLTAEGQDAKLSESKFEMGRNFCNKLWNASRFTLMRLEQGSAVSSESQKLSLADSWILHRLAETIHHVRSALDVFSFHEAAQKLYHFVWNDFCDWYLEVSKFSLHRKTLLHVLSETLKLLHPFCPFLTEEIWKSVMQRVAASGASSAPTGAHDAPSRQARGSENRRLLMTEKFPSVVQNKKWKKEYEGFELIKDVVIAIRVIRGEHNVKPKQRVRVLIFGASKEEQKILNASQDILRELALAESLEVISEKNRPQKAATTVVHGFEVMVPYEGLVDIPAEKERLEKEIARARQEKEIVEKKLSHAAFVRNAPKTIVQKERDRLAAVIEMLDKLQRAKEALSA